MAQDKSKQVSQITNMEVDFAQWYTDVCKKAELIDYSSITVSYTHLLYTQYMHSVPLCQEEIFICPSPVCVIY